MYAQPMRTTKVDHLSVLFCFLSPDVTMSVQFQQCNLVNHTFPVLLGHQVLCVHIKQLWQHSMVLKASREIDSRQNSLYNIMIALLWLLVITPSLCLPVPPSSRMWHDLRRVAISLEGLNHIIILVHYRRTQCISSAEKWPLAACVPGDGGT